MSEPETDQAQKANQELFERIRLSAIHLREQGQLDTIHVFATRRAEGRRTLIYDVGEGDWYARYGQIREWLLQEEEISRERVRPKE